MKENQAIISCSGGLDSVVLAKFLNKKNPNRKFKVVFFYYGQKSAEAERKCSKKCAEDIGAEFIEINLGFLHEISTSLINKKGLISQISLKDLKDTSKESQKFYVPMRNTLFISALLSLAESEFIKTKIKSDIYLGFKSEGREPYPDTTPEYLELINRLSKKTCLYPIMIKAPFIKKDKEDIILIGKKLGVDFTETHSCYISNKPCKKCLACTLRAHGFYWANLEAVMDN